MEGYAGWFLSVLAPDEATVWAVGYSDAGFKRLRTGMTERDVAAILGEPLESYLVEGSPDLVGWRYSRGAKDDASYHERAVLFRDGEVVEVFCDFYVD